MRKYRLLYLVVAVLGANFLALVDANAATVKKTDAQKGRVDAKQTAPAISKKLSKAQQAEEANRAAEAQAKAAEKTKLRAEQEAGERADAEAKARTEAEARARAEAEASAKRAAELSAREKPLLDAEALMKDGKAAAAYALLEPLDFERSGEVRFDYLLGIAALDSGKPDKATLAFERVLAVEPNFAGARLDMARAYYQLGDLSRAKTEFEDVLKQNPPEAARATVRKYLDSIAAYAQAKKTRVSGYIEGMVGHDSNVNTGTGSSTSIVSLIPWWPDPTQQIAPSKRSSDYYGVAEGVDVSRTLNANWSVYAGADLRLRSNTTQELAVYDSSSIGGRAGVMYASEQNAYKLTLTDGDSYSGKTMRTNSLGLNAEWQHTFSSSNQMNAFAQYGQNRAFGFAPTDLNRTTNVRVEGDTDQVIAGAGWLHIMADGKQALFGSISVGSEFDVAPVIPASPPTVAGPANGGRLDGKKRFESLRVGGQASFTEKVDGFTSVGWQHASYAKVNAFINNGNGSRNENQYDLTVGANWHLDKLWALKPQITLSKKTSNLALYSFDRTDVSLTIRRDFK